MSSGAAFQPTSRYQDVVYFLISLLTLPHWFSKYLALRYVAKKDLPSFSPYPKCSHNVNNPIKIVIISNYIPHYRYPVFKKMKDSGKYDMTIYTTMPLSSSVESARKQLSLIYPKGINIDLRTRHLKVRVGQKEKINIPVLLPFNLYASKPKIIISGNMGSASLVSMVVAKILKVPFVIWTEEIKVNADDTSRLQKIFRSILLPRTTAFLTWGNPAKDYLQEKGFSEEKLYYCAQAVDNEWWIKTTKNHDTQKIKLRMKLFGRVFLLAGQHIPRKGFDKVLDAWSRLDRDIQKANHLVVAGEGEENNNLKQIAQKARIPNILFTGQKNQSELSEIFSAADVLIFPSLVDVWGMVVNEAMCSGLPVLASKYAGSSHELIISEEYGELIDPLDIDSLTQILLKWINQDLPNPAIIRKWIQKINFDLTVNAFDKIIEKYTTSEYHE